MKKHVPTHVCYKCSLKYTSQPKQQLHTRFDWTRRSKGNINLEASKEPQNLAPQKNVELGPESQKIFGGKDM